MVSSATSTKSRPAQARTKVNRKDPAKRKAQNRQSQKTYREKQRRRIEELERRAALAPTKLPSTSTQAAEALDLASQPPYSRGESPPANPPGERVTEEDAVGSQGAIDPSLLIQPPAIDTVPSPAPAPSLESCPYVDSTSSALVVDRHDVPADADLHFLSTEFDRWLQEGSYTFPSPYQSPASPSPSPSPLPPPSSSRTSSSSSSSKQMSSAWTTMTCTCPGVHGWQPNRTSASDRGPPRCSSSPAPSLSIKRSLRVDMWCALSAMLENCLHLGITRAMFCADESQSPFFRITDSNAAVNTAATTDQDASSSSEESRQLIRRVRSIHGTIKYDLRPIDDQILRSHHPYIDILPFRDLRRNLIACQREIDEDEFIIDFLNNATCWGNSGGGGGCRANGSPWDGRSWEANEEFLQKWWSLVGGEDGELTRTSRWWREMRGERVTEVF